MNKMLVVFIAFFTVASAQATIGMSCATNNSKTLDLNLDTLQAPNEKGIAFSTINSTESFTSELQGVKMNPSVTVIKTKQGEGWLVVKIDINGNGKFEADAVLYLDKESSFNEEDPAAIYTGDLNVYTKDPQNPTKEPVACIISM